MLHPLIFQPIFQERVWGGRRIAELYGKKLPPEVPIGESWEISDRPGAVSVIANGPLAGRDLHWLAEHHPDELFGAMYPRPKTFPWLIKILDARDRLSLQVHPPPEIAAELGGEPKTEMWYVAAADPGADIFAGLKRGVTRGEFARKTADGTVADCFHRIEVKPGDCLFLRSGRVHALGAGNVIFEIQQNSDTTYRVFDWNRAGLDGRPRELHLEKSLRSIDFDDFEPTLVETPFDEVAHGHCRQLVNDPLFRVEEVRLDSGRVWLLPPGRMQVIAVVKGHVIINSPAGGTELQAGGFCLLPACLADVTCRAAEETILLHVQPGD